MTQLTQRIAQSYDELPYSSACYHTSSPENLRTVAHLFGLEAPPLARARVLELGCAAGGNLISFAARHPEAVVVGVELSSVQVEAGQRTIGAMGLDNARIEQGSIVDIDASLGQFDYILCHGVYSWVPEEVRTAILRVARERLSPQGIAFVSYNTYPGWKAKEVVRDAMLLRGGNRAGVMEQLAYAGGMIEFLHEMAPKDSVLAKIMNDNIGTIRHGDATYLAHEFLELCNAPCYFRDFIDAARQQGLEYLGDAEVASMFASNFGADAAKMLIDECGGDQVVLEQLMDFLANRPFRQTLLVHAERGTQVRYQLDAARIANLHVGGEYVASESATTWSTARGQTLTVHEPVNQAALATIAAAWPGTVAVQDLIQQAEAEDSEAGRSALLAFIVELITSNAINHRLDPVALNAAIDERPRVRPSLRKLAALKGSTSVALFNEWHSFVPAPDSAGWLLLPLLDGERDLESLTAALIEAVHDGSLKLLRDGNEVVDRIELQAVAVEVTRQAIVWLGRRAMLLPSDGSPVQDEPAPGAAKAQALLQAQPPRGKKKQAVKPSKE